MIYVIIQLVLKHLVCPVLFCVSNPSAHGLHDPPSSAFISFTEQSEQLFLPENSFPAGHRPEKYYICVCIVNVLTLGLYHNKTAASIPKATHIHLSCMNKNSKINPPHI